MTSIYIKSFKTYWRSIIIYSFILLLLGSFFVVYSPGSQAALDTSCENNQPPVAVISPIDPVIELGETITFSAAQSTDTNSSGDLGDRLNRVRSRSRSSSEPLLTYNWVVPALNVYYSGETFEFTPPQAGSYSINLQVYDECGALGIGYTLLQVNESDPEPNPNPDPDALMITIAEDSSSPISPGLLIGGSSKVTMGVLSIYVLESDYYLRSLHFTHDPEQGGAYNDELTRVYLYDGGTLVDSVVPTTTNSVTFEIPDEKLLLGQDLAKRLTIKVDVAGVTNNRGDSNTGDAGDDISFDLLEGNYNFVERYSGYELRPENMVGGFRGHHFFVFKSVPIFYKQVLSSNNLYDGGDIPVYRFKIEANPKGDVGLYKCSFIITTSGLDLYNLELFENPNTGSEVNLTFDSARTPVAYTSNNWLLDVLFDVSTDGRGDIRTVAAGSSKTFELRGMISGSNAGDFVSVAMLGDHARGGVYPDIVLDVDSSEQNDFIWSDLHYMAATSGSVNIAEWFNGYKVPGLPSTTTVEILTRDGGSSPPDPEPEPTPSRRILIRTRR